jgi:hypothetical protein
MMPEIKKKIDARFSNITGRYDNGYNRKRIATSIINEFMLTPNIGSLIEETGLMHESWCSEGIAYLDRERLPGQGFWNAVGRFLGIREKVLYVYNNGQIWLCRYFHPHYYFLCDRIKEFYHEYLAKHVSDANFVILNK